MVFKIYNCKKLELNQMHKFIYCYNCCCHIIINQSLNISHKNLMTCTLIVRLHKYIICFDLDMYFLIDSNMLTIVMTINKCMHLVMFYYFAVINCKYHNLLKSYIYLKLTAF